jgi:hypothetical protein
LNWINLDETQIINEMQFGSEQAQAHKIYSAEKKLETVMGGYNLRPPLVLINVINYFSFLFLSLCGWPLDENSEFFFFLVFRFLLASGSVRKTERNKKIIYPAGKKGRSNLIFFVLFFQFN